jgi:hypothetical protein
MESGSSPLSCGIFLPSPLLQAFPLLVAWHVLLLLPSPTSLLIYSSMRDFPSPPLWLSGCPALFATCLFLLLLLIVQFFFSFFPGWGLVRLGGYADLAQCCLLEYCMLLSSACGLRLPKRSGSWCLAVAQVPSWFLCLT